MRRLTAASCGVLVLVSACNSKSPTEPAPPACTFTLSTAALTFDASGGSASITVSTGGACTWTATSDRNWMSVTSGSSGTGNGTVNVTVLANPETEPRSGSLTIAGQRVTVTEEGRTPCAVDLPVGEAVYGEHPRAGSFEVRAADGCGWTATTPDSWIEITSGREGSGNGTVGYAIDRNRDPQERTGRIHVNERTFVIVQAGAAAECDYAVAPVTLDACMSVPFELSTTVTTGPGCTWTVTADVPWITLVSPASGSGTAQISFRLSDNWDDPRNGRVMVRWPTATAGQNVQVNQAGCRYGVSASEIAVPADGGSRTFDVVQQSDPITCGGALQDRCLWTAAADVDWIRITTPMPRTGDDRVAFTVDPNPGTSARSGSIMVRNQTVRIVQAAK